jgi:hypothetical protein
MIVLPIKVADQMNHKLPPWPFNTTNKLRHFGLGGL